MLDRFRQHLERSGLKPESGRVLVGYSGGADSTCLLHMLHASGVSVIAAHLNHGQRPEADEELDKCAKFCEELGVPFVSGRADVPKISRARKIGLEEAGREARYEFFRQSLSATGCELIATAHTRDDHIETVILNLTRGTGLSGLAGIPIRRDNIVRPLLPLSREETRHYCEEYGLWFHDDPANTDPKHARSRVRGSVIPELRGINPSFDRTVARLARIAGEEDDLLDAIAGNALQQCEIEMNGSLRPLTLDSEAWFDRSKLRHLQPALLRRALRLAMAVVGCALDFDQTDHAAQKIAGTGKGSITAEGGGSVLEWDERTVAVRRLEPQVLFRMDLPIAGGRRARVADGMTIITSPMDPAHYMRERGALEVVVDRDAIQGDLFLRNPEPGDSLVPLGMKGTKKVTDLMADAKLTEGARRRLPIVCDAEGPIWVPGLAMADRAKVTEKTAGALEIRLV